MQNRTYKSLRVLSFDYTYIGNKGVEYMVTNHYP